MLGDPPIDDAHCVDRLEAHLPAGSRNTEEVAEMGAVISLKRRDHITVGLLPMDVRGEVGKCVPQPAVKFEHASLIRLTAWLRCMIMEIIGEQFVEQLPITTALHFDRVAADNRLGGLADTVRHHYLHLRLEFDTAEHDQFEPGSHEPQTSN